MHCKVRSRQKHGPLLRAQAVSRAVRKFYPVLPWTEGASEPHISSRLLLKIFEQSRCGGRMGALRAAARSAAGCCSKSSSRAGVGGDWGLSAQPHNQQQTAAQVLSSSLLLIVQDLLKIFNQDWCVEGGGRACTLLDRTFGSRLRARSSGAGPFGVASARQG